MKTAPRQTSGALVPVSRPRLRLFQTYVKWYLRRHFNALRIAHAERSQPGDSAGPLIVYVNHPSWWDPLTGLLVSSYLFPRRDHYAPMDSAALAHYGILQRLGMFPVEQGTRHGAAQFLGYSMQVLSSANRALWITPQGAFTDVRKRPLPFRPGLAALAARVPGATIIPVGFEYTFWDERLPEILVNIGKPVPPSHAATLESSMTATLDELAALALTRNPAAFETILTGAAGVGGIYGRWQRLRAVLSGGEYRSQHGSIRRP